MKLFKLARQDISSGSRKLVPIYAGILVTFALVPVWYRFPRSPGSFAVDYSLGFLIFWPMLWTVGWWLVGGLPGFSTLRRDRVRCLWALALLLLVCWAFLSWSWAFTRGFRPEIVAGSALPLGVSALFALVVACAAPPLRWIVAVLVLGLVVNSAVAGWQTARQGPTDLKFLGEFNINPANSGVSVVQADGVRWLRPYGLLPHPNMLAGFLVIGIMAAFVPTLVGKGWRRYGGLAILLFGLWALLLTFSRGAWLGLAAGAFAILPLLWGLRSRLSWRWLAVTALLISIMGAAFFALYRPFLVARAGLGDPTLEQRSISDRAIFTEYAYTAIEKSPVLGVGLGNFPWLAARLLLATDYDLKGLPVHHVLLSAWSELGLVGFGLVVLVLLFGIEAVFRALRGDQTTMISRSVLLGAVIALMVIGLLDHYPWTTLHFQAAWWGLLAAAGRPGD